MSEPLLSVCLITYNHANYIKEAIDGVLMQKVNFSWELIIADDFSTDGTREIVLEYKKKYPDFITLILQEKNVGPAKNWMDLITYPKSKYIAYFEGDDFWTDPHKLQMQVDILEANVKFSFCCHRYKVLFQSSNNFEDRIYPLNFPVLLPLYKGVIITIKEYHDVWMTQMLTTVFRKEAILESINQSSSFKYFRDTHVFYYLLKQGQGLCLDFVGGVYRINSGGVYSGVDLSKRLLNDFLIYEELYQQTKDILFLKKYIYLAYNLMIRGHNIITVFKSLFFNLSFKDKVNIIKARLVI